MGTLYVVGVPATGTGDLTIRARRILGSVTLVAAGAGDEARLFLAGCDISTPVVPAAGHGIVLGALAGGDVALLLPGRSPAPGSEEQSLVAAALAGGFAVVPVPGPVVAVTALVLSGLPADSFVYLGALPQEAGARRSLLESMAGEARTLALLAGPGELPDLLAALHSSWGDRSLVLWPASSEPPEDAWRGSLGEALQAGAALAAGRDWVLIAGGAAEERGRPWDEDRLRREIRACLGRGLGVGEISRELAAPSGWARRDVYRLSLQEHEQMGK
jgi:16S rRNA (cytidine1402-2'-O)-methyltransferase